MATDTEETANAWSSYSDSLDDERGRLLRDNTDTVRIVSGGRQSTSAVQGSSWFASVFLVVNAALGAGLLNFPAAFDKSGGVVIAISIQAVLMIFIFGALIILAFCSDLEHSATYQDTVYYMCGQLAQTACAICVILYTFGTCITFFIIIGDQWDKFLTFVHGEDYCLTWYMNRSFTMTVTSIILVLPICFPKRIDFLKYASFIGVLGVVYCVLLVTAKYFIGPLHPGPIKESPTNWMDVFLVVPVICFGYQCHVSVIPIYSCMKKRTVREFSKTILAALAICIFAYTGTASFGYLSFGSNVNEDILLSYKPTPDVLVAVILIAAKMYTTYPILLFVGRAAVDGQWVKLRGLSVEAILSQERKRRIVITILWFASTLTLAVLIPNIGVVISMLGGLASIFIFIFPGMCLFQVLSRGHINSGEQRIVYILLMTMAVGYLIIGAFLFGLTSAQAIISDLRPQISQDIPNKYGCL